MNSDSFERLASERLVPHEVENFVGEVTFLATPRGVDYEPTLHSLVCELHEHLSKRTYIYRSLRNSIIPLRPDILFSLPFNPLSSEKRTERERETVKVNCSGSLERRLDCSLIGKKKNSTINISMCALPKITQLPIVGRKQSCILCRVAASVLLDSAFYDALSTLCSLQITFKLLSNTTFLRT